MDVDAVIKRVLDFNGIEAEIITREFRYHKSIHKELNGIYILTHLDKVMYVGKGQIKKRQLGHWKKANGDLKPKDPPGWHWLYKNANSDAKDWTIRYLILHKQTELSAVEGCLIHKLQPLANNETFIDEGRAI